MTNREPDAWPTGIGAITLFVEDVRAAKEFYRTVFGLPESKPQAHGDWTRLSGGS